MEDTCLGTLPFVNTESDKYNDPNDEGRNDLDIGPGPGVTAQTKSRQKQGQTCAQLFKSNQSATCTRGRLMHETYQSHTGEIQSTDLLQQRQSV